MTATPQVSNRVATFLRTRTATGRLIFALDATASRQPTWDAACTLQFEMFREAAAIGGLEVQLIYYRGIRECRASHWTENAQELGNLMVRIACQAGATQIQRVLEHIRKETASEPVNAAVFIGDACEEMPPGPLYDVAAKLLGVPLFVFQEGDDPEVEEIFRELARLTAGAYCQFNTGAARQLGELLKAVAAFAAGGRKALVNMNSDSARKLLGQLK
jgi:hypothetical protein